MSRNHDWNQRKALGKGLSALLPPKATVNPVVQLAAEPAPAPPKSELPENFEDFQSIPLDQILPGPEQPREVFDQDRLLELAQSIQANGLLQPITVEKHADGKYRILAGERRWRASQLIGLKTIPALVRIVDNSHRLELALIENIQREDLGPLEIATAFERLVTDHGMSHEKIAERTGKDRSTVTNFLRLLRLSDEVKSALKNGAISMGHAKTLLNLDNETDQIEVCKAIIAKRLSVRQAENLVKQMAAARGLTPKPEKEEKKVDPNIKAALEEIAMALGTKVHLGPRRLEIEYYSSEDLERIYTVIVKQ